MRGNIVLICPTTQAVRTAADWLDGQLAHGRSFNSAYQKRDRTQLNATAGTDSAQSAFSPHQRNAYAISTEARPAGGHLCMKNFSDASFSPDVIALMTEALNASVAALPEPVSSTNVNLLAEAVLRAAKAGERDVTAMQRLALLELQIMPRM
ncbi:hypothetical protein [Bradyrhizobium sp. SZCCHNR1053]|uniref:hypothetical protein n=1 Tax=unclassified Bradyrhizobium TaxID=2631580 RepID=UPI0039655CEA